MKGKYIYVEVVSRVLNDKGRKKLKEYQEVDEYEEPVDSEGRSRSWFEDMGIRPPKDLTDKEKLLQQDLEFDEDDYDDELEETFLTVKSIEFATNNYDGGCTIFTKGGNFLKVADDIDDVLAQIHYVNMSVWDTIKEWIKNKFRKQNDN